MNSLTYGSVCSGIEAATMAWHPLGWKPAFFSEIEPFPSAVLAHHYPHVPNLGDMTLFQEWPDAALDVLVGGTPCQSFSVAGLRKGMADPRGNLALVYLALADRYRPRWLVWENVPGVLSSNGGRDFGAFLGGLGQLGYGFAYRVLDAQYFGVAQRRRRVFVVGHLGDWRRAAAVLFERHGLQGHPAPSRETGKRIARGAARSVALRGRDGGSAAELGDDCGFTLRASSGGGDKPHALIAFSCKDSGQDAGEITPTLRSMNHDASHANGGGQVAVAFGWQNSASQGDSASVHVSPTLDKSKTPAVAVDCYNHTLTGDIAATMSTTGGPPLSGPGVIQNMAVRRLTPRECERLQGFPDDYTNIPWREGKAVAEHPRGPKRKETPDGPRYKALGNSMAVPCMAWIGRRIAEVDAISVLEKVA